MTPDENYMQQAVDLAWQGRFGAHPNPMVGAVVVRKGKVVGCGYHAEYGGPHAEIAALKDAGDLSSGATLYVTLEPCRHHGKTPPCTQAILASGVSRVVIGTLDPDHSMAGGGAKILSEAGLEVVSGILEPLCQRLIRCYTKRVTQGRPWVTLKCAVTLDGKIATRTGSSKWITSELARRRVHEKRAEVDGIITGIGTVVHDDPMLDVRLEGHELRPPHRIILDRDALLSLDSQIAGSAGRIRTTLVVSDQIPDERTEALASCGAQMLRIRCDSMRFDWSELLDWCGAQPMNEVLIEAGGKVAGDAFDHKAIDSVMIFIAPKLFGGQSAPSPLEALGVKNAGDAAEIVDRKCSPIGDDLLIEGDVVYS